MGFKKVYKLALFLGSKLGIALLGSLPIAASASDESISIEGGYVTKKTAYTFSSDLMEKGRQTLLSGQRTFAGPWRGMSKQYLWFEMVGGRHALYLRVNGMREMELCDTFKKNIPIQVTGLQRKPEIKRSLQTNGYLRCEPLQISSYPYINSYPLIEIQNASEIFDYFWDLSAVNFQFELDSMVKPNWPKTFDLVYTAMGFRKNHTDMKK